MEVWNLSFFADGDWLIGTNINSTLFYLRVNYDKKKLEAVTETINVAKGSFFSLLFWITADLAQKRKGWSLVLAESGGVWLLGKGKPDLR